MLQNPQYQQQGKGRPQGQYYSDENAKPTEVGIAGITRDERGRYQSKEKKAYDVKPDAPYMESTAAPCPDSWSVDGQTVQTRGGGTQRGIGDRSHAPPGKELLWQDGLETRSTVELIFLHSSQLRGL